jgi:hypothetical protein
LAILVALIQVEEAQDLNRKMNRRTKNDERLDPRLSPSTELLLRGKLATRTWLSLFLIVAASLEADNDERLEGFETEFLEAVPSEHYPQRAAG